MLANVARTGIVKVSDGSWNMRKAVDGSIDTWWSADDYAPQWFDVDFASAHLVTKIELVVSQVRPGPASHTLTAKRNGKTVIWHRFDTDQSSDGHVFTLKLNPPRPIDNIRIRSTRHEGWVAIRELRIMTPLPEYTSVAASGLTEPVYLTHANDSRLFVVEKAGRIRIIEDGKLLPTPFLDISAKVDTSVDRGLTGLAFSPAYAVNGYFYVSYVTPDNQNVLSRFSARSDPYLADTDSEEVILTFHQPGVRHTIGTLSFGPDDLYLYIAVGDGQYKPPELAQSAQDPNSLLGKILRINVESGAFPYAIPPDNPFALAPGHAPEIWALGLRNPWGIAFDQKNSHLYIPDSGQHTNEEINFQPADSLGAANYGWPVYEGPLRHGAAAQDQQAESLTFPVAHYSHANGCAIVGGAVVAGAFYYADFCRGHVWELRQSANGWLTRQITTIQFPISSISAGEDGTLYATGYADGNIYRITPHHGTDGGNASSPN